MIRIENIKKTFNKHRKNKVTAINNTTLTLEDTGLVAILGESGCGKTTLLNVIGGLDNVDKGNIYIDGKKFTHISSYKKDKIRNLTIGYIFQDYKLIENMSVYDNVAIVLKMIGIKNNLEIEKRVLYTLDKVNMLRYKKRPVNMLSGGERQRVGIARAIVKNPKIIIADEPTGNLDSRNSIEIMNIIKKISEDRLVILVTHERELAEFYSNRIIEINDGTILKDYQNKDNKKLNYRIENKIYLKDFNYIRKLKKENININLYSDKEENINIDLVFKNGNIYIKTNDSNKVEVVENNIELVNDHYKELEDLEELDFDIDKICNKTYKERYSSIFRLGNFITKGFNKVINYPLLKKLLLGGFFISGMFIFLAVSYSLASISIKDSDFVTVNKNYLQARVHNLKVSDYLNLESDLNNYYVLPSDSKVSFIMEDDNYYQTYTFSTYLKGSLASISMLNKDNLIFGKTSSNSKEIVIDKQVLENSIKEGGVVQIGISNYKEFLNRKVSINNLGDFTIVGITDLGSPSIYVDNSLLLLIISNNKNEDDEIYMSYSSTNDESNIILFDYSYDTSKYKLEKGRVPTNDYEIIINKDLEYTYFLNKEINYKINGKKLKVVGYFSTLEDNYKNMYLTNINTIKYNLIRKSNTISVYSKDNKSTIDNYLTKNIKLSSSYKISKEEYKDSIHNSVKKTLIICSIMIFISLLEIYLMIRSSFLSRVKEVGIYRAIGVKKSDIYKMFTGEIFAITTISSNLGILFMSYCLYNLSNTELLQDKFMVNPITIILSIIFIYIFNILVGLLPVYKTMRKTPASILSRTDI